MWNIQMQTIDSNYRQGGSSPCGCKVVEHGFDPRTFGLWAQDAKPLRHSALAACSTAPLEVSYHRSKQTLREIPGKAHSDLT